MTGDKQHEATTEFNEALAAGFAAGNFEALGPFYTEDATVLPPRGKILEGRAAAAAFWSGVANRFISVNFTTATLKPLGEAARRETGTYAMGGGAQPVEGKYVFVWQLVDGEWQIESAIWNRSGEAGAARGQGQNQGQRRGGGQAGGGQGGAYRGGAGAGQGGGYRGGGQGGQGGYRGGGRPSFQGGGGGGIGGGGRGPAGGRRGGPGGGQGGGNRGGQGGYGGDAGGGSLYDGNAGLYSNPKD